MKRLTLIAFLISFAFSIGSPAVATEADRLNNVINAAIEAVYGTDSKGLSLEEKEARVDVILESQYDIDVIIRRAIGRNWNLMNEKEQEQVLDLVKKLVVRTYVKAMQGLARPQVEVGEPVMITDKRMEIPSVIKLDDTIVNVLYRLGKMQSGWQIYDIVAEDISIVSNYRQQIDDHFRKGNGQELIKKLKELLNKPDIDEDIKL